MEGLHCWVCTGNASPLCQPGRSLSEGHDRKGVSEPCPYPNNNSTFNETNWSCMIMESVVKSTDRVEITKGCVRHYAAFRKHEENPLSKYLVPSKDPDFEGYCYTHDDTQVQRGVFYHEVTVCICKKDNCNKRELTLRSEKGAKIREVGFADIEQMLAVTVSGACTLKIVLITLPLFLILMNLV